MNDRKQFGSSLRPISKKRMAQGVKRSFTPKKRTPKECPTVEGLIEQGLVVRGSTFRAKPKPMKKRSDSNKGWWDVALEIWEERPKQCEVCGVPLQDEPLPINFSHLLPRGSYRKYKRDKRNIIIKCAWDHQRWHDKGPEWLSENGDPRWFGVCVKYFQLRDEANGL